MSADPARRIAGQLERRGLAAPARLLLDAHRPLAPLLADAAAALGPLLRTVRAGPIDDVRRLIEDEAGIDRLIAEVDGVGERHAESG